MADGGDGGGSGFLTKKVGPLPVWGWAVVVVAVWWFFLRKKTATTTSATSSTGVTTYTAPTETVTYPTGTTYSGPVGYGPGTGGFTPTGKRTTATAPSSPVTTSPTGTTGTKITTPGTSTATPGGGNAGLLGTALSAPIGTQSQTAQPYEIGQRTVTGQAYTAFKFPSTWSETQVATALYGTNNPAALGVTEEYAPNAAGHAVYIPVYSGAPSLAGRS